MKATSLMVCVVLATGCTRSDSEKVGKTTLTSATATNLAPTTSFLETDPLLTRSVEVALAVDPQRSMAAQNVEVSVEEGVATLDGTVTDVKTLRELEATVSEVPGVRAVNDRLEVSTLRDRDGDESDDRIAFALQRSSARSRASRPRATMSTRSRSTFSAATSPFAARPRAPRCGTRSRRSPRRRPASSR